MYIVDFQYNFYTNKNYRLLIKSLFMYKPMQITLSLCFFLYYLYATVYILIIIIMVIFS